MNPKVIWDAVAGIARTVNAVLSFIPALVWAIALGLSMLYGSLMHHERDHAVAEKNVIVATYEQLVAKVVLQKKEARELLEKLTAEVAAAQAKLNDARKAQEKKDAENERTIAAQARRLVDAAAAHGGQLRDPNGPGGCRASPEGQGGAAAGAGGKDPAEAGGLLSKQLSGLLARLTGEADDINAAYASCRADAVEVRRALGAEP